MSLEKLEYCPLCNSSNLQAVQPLKDHSTTGETFQISHCIDCDLRFTNPRPDEQSIGPYYESDHYISHNNSSQGIVAKLYHQVRKITLNQKLNLIRPLINNGPVLDYGTGTGAIVKHFNDSGVEAYGYEPSATARQAGERDHKIQYIDVFADDKKFDVITLWHVLEHVHKLEQTITTLKSKLNDGGHLILALPNHESKDAQTYGEFWAAWDIPIHLYHFNKTSIKVLSKQFGFDLKQILPMKFDAFYVSLLSSKYQTGKTQFLSAFLNGLRSNLAAGKDNYSSLIYVLKKI